MVSLIISGMFALFLIVGFLVGLSRGLKRTCVRGAWLVVVLVLLLILSTNITMQLLKLPLGTWFGLSVDGTKCATISEYLTLTLESTLAVDGVDYAGTVNILLTLISMIINGVVFLICYWVLNLITLLLYYFFNIFIFMGERRKKKELKKQGKKLKKHRLAGAFVGMALGLVAFFCTVTPMVGYISVAKSVEQESAKKSGSDTGLLTEYVGSTYTDIMKQYDNSAAGKTFKALGLDNLMLKIMDLNSSVTINKQKLKLSEEAVSITDIVYEVKNLEKLSDLNLKTCTKSEFGGALDDMDNLVNALFNSKVVTVCTDVVVPIGVKYARKQIKTDDFKPYVANFMNACFDSMENINSTNTKAELTGVIGLVRTLNDSNLLLPIIQQNTGDIFTFLKTNLTKEVSTKIVDEVFSLNTANNVAPAMVNMLLGAGADQLKYDYTTEDQVNAETLKDVSLTFLTSAVDVMQDISKTDDKYSVNLTANLSSALGGMFDTIREVVSPQNFKNIVESLEPKLNDLVLDQLSNSPNFIKNNVTLTINNLSEITSFREVFNSLYSSYNIVKTQLDTSKVDGKYDVDKMDFVEIGKALNDIQSNQLLQNDVLKRVMLDAIDYYGDKYESEISPTFKFTFREQLVANINNNMGGNKKINWQTEFPRYKATLSLAVKLADDPNLAETVKKPEDNTLEIIGEQLDDDLKQSVLFGGCTRDLVYDIVGYAQEKVEFSTDLKTQDSILKLLTDAKTNVKDPAKPDSAFVWKQEFGHIKSLMNIKFDETGDENIVSIAKTLDTIVNDKVDGEGSMVSAKSQIITKPMLNNFIVDYLDNVFGEIDETSDFYDTIMTIKNGFSTGEFTSYENEFNALLKLKSCKEEFDGTGFDFKNRAAVVVLGEKIDTALSYNATIVSKTLVNNYLKKVINKEVTLSGQYAVILTNIVGTTTTPARLDAPIRYASEFGYVSDLMTISNDFGTVSIETINTATNPSGKKLGECFDAVAYSYLVGDAGYIVIKTALNDYKNDAENANYLSITNVIYSNYAGLETQMAFAPNENFRLNPSGSFVTYTTLVNNLDEFYQAVGGSNRVTGSFNNLTELDSAVAAKYDSTLATLQNNIVVNKNGTIEIALYAMAEVDKNAIDGTKIKEYITNYTKYLNLVKIETTISAQPYNGDTETLAYSVDGFSSSYALTEISGATSIRINKPFENLKTLIEANI